MTRSFPNYSIPRNNGCFSWLKGRIFVLLNTQNDDTMNCFNHPQEPAVAQCSDCGKGLCRECAEWYQPILCTPCFQKRKRSEIWQSIFSLLFLIALFVIGFRWNFLETKDFENMRWMSGYVLMAIWSGYLFVEKFMSYIQKFIPNIMIIAPIWLWVIYYIIKLILFAIIGFFTAPFTWLWAVIRVIKAFR